MQRQPLDPNQVHIRLERITHMIARVGADIHFKENLPLACLNALNKKRAEPTSPATNDETVLQSSIGLFLKAFKVVKNTTRNTVREAFYTPILNDLNKNNISSLMALHQILKLMIGGQGVHSFKYYLLVNLFGRKKGDSPSLACIEESDASTASEIIDCFVDVIAESMSGYQNTESMLSIEPISKEAKEKDSVILLAPQQSHPQPGSLTVDIELLAYPELVADVWSVIGGFLKPNRISLRALDKITALKHIKQQDSLSEPEKVLALEAKQALITQSRFACCSRLFHQTMQFTLNRLGETLQYHVKRGNLALIEEILKSYYEKEKLLSQLLSQSYIFALYPSKSLTLIQLAYLEKNGRMCQVLKEAFKQLPNGIEMMQTQLYEPFIQSRNQVETPYNFDSLVTAIRTDTNVEVELAMYREDLARIIAERGFPLTIFLQIIDIFIASFGIRWTPNQYAILFLHVFGGAQKVSPDWLKRAFALGIHNADSGQPTTRLPFVLESGQQSIDPHLDDHVAELRLEDLFDLLAGRGFFDKHLGFHFFVDLFGGGVGAVRTPERLLHTSLETLLKQTQQSLAGLCSESSAQFTKS